MDSNIPTHCKRYNNLEICLNNMCVHLKFSKIENVKICGTGLKKRWAPENDEDPFKISLEILNMGSISTPENMR